MRQGLDRSGKAFFVDVIKLVSGSAIAQILMVLFLPILTRFYFPSDFGAYSIFASITGIISAISCLRYENAILLPKTDEEAANMMGVSLFMSSAVSLLMVPFIWLGGPLLLSILKMPSLGEYLWLIPPITFFGGATLGHPALNNWNTRKKRFGRISIIQVINAVIIVGWQISAGIVGRATGGSLIGGVFVGSIISTSLLGWLVWREGRDIFIKNINFKDMISGIKRYRKFPLYDSWATLLNSVSWQLPIFVLSFYFSPIAVGFYALGNSVLRIPMNLVGSAIAQVFLQRAAEANIKNELAIIVERVFRYLVVLGMFPMLLLSIIGRDLFIVLFGNNWAESGVYVQILSIWMFFWFISSPLSVLFRVLEKQGFLLLLNIVIFLTRLLSLIIGGWFNNVYLALVLFSVSGIIVYGYLSLAITSFSGVSKMRIAQILLRNLLLFIPCGSLILIIQKYIPSPVLIVVIAIGILGLYFLYFFLSETKSMHLVKRE